MPTSPSWINCFPEFTPDGFQFSWFLPTPSPHFQYLIVEWHSAAVLSHRQSIWSCFLGCSVCFLPLPDILFVCERHNINNKVIRIFNDLFVFDAVHVKTTKMASKHCSFLWIRPKMFSCKWSLINLKRCIRRRANIASLVSLSNWNHNVPPCKF